MKKNIMLVLLAILVPAMPLAAQEKMFAEVAKMPDVESVFVGGAILKLAKGAQTITDNKYARSVKNIDAIEVISCESEEAVDAVAEACQKIIDSMNLEVILEANENREQRVLKGSGKVIQKGGVERSIIYGGPMEEGRPKMKNMIVVNQSPDEFQLVYIRGCIDISDVVSGD